MIKRYFLLILALFLPLLTLKASSACCTHAVTVSIAPYKFFIDQIAGDTIQLSMLVPPGASFHDYEPRPKQVLEVAKADIWFRVGEVFENRAIEALKNYNPRLKIVDLRDGVDLITFDGRHQHGAAPCSHCKVTGADLHMWLSARQSKIQAKQIASALIETYPENRAIYEANLAKLLFQLDQLDQEITAVLAPLTNRTIMVGHPAYAYFARDYHLVQFPIEYEGKDPSPRQMHEILLRAKREGIKTIFVQSQYSSRGADLIAKELGAKVVSLEPYSGDYFSAMRKIAYTIASENR